MPADVLPVKDKLLNVFAPTIACDVPAGLVKLTLLNVTPLPPLMLGPLPDKTRLEVPALKVKFVEVVKIIAAPAEVSVTVLLPKSIVRSLELLATICKAVRLKFPVLKAPLVTVIEAVTPKLAALPSVQPQPTPFTVMSDERATPLVVIVLPVADPVNVIAPV